MLLGLTVAILVLTGLADSNQTQRGAIPGEYLVKLSEKSFQKMKAESQVGISGVSVKKFLSPASKVVVVKSKLNIESLKNALSKSFDIEFIEPNAVFTIQGYLDNQIPQDPNFSDLWGMHNTGQKDSAGQTGVAGIDMDAARAWHLQTGSRDIVVAVIDTGIDPDIEDLKNNMWVNEAEANGQAGVDDDGNGFVDDIHGFDFANNDSDPVDDHGHGSHCAGTIGAEGNNNIAVAGVVWNVRLMALKFLSSSGSGTLEGAVQAIDYATQNGAHLTSNSWGCASASCNSQALKESIERASAAGVLFVAAAGNSSANNDTSHNYPSNFETPNMVAVAAIDNRGNKASFSSYGKTKVHVGAPGVKILSTTPSGLQSWSGTSMATPHVAGLAALLLSQEPGLEMAELKNRILGSTRPLSTMRNFVATGGIANAYHALSNTTPEPDPNDPYVWSKVDVQGSTPHPYLNSTTQEFEYSVPGATSVAAFFSSFRTESGYDLVKFFDRDGNQYGSISGDLGEGFSPVVPGDYIKIVFTTDASVQDHGFDITKVAYK
jgi:subtilisin family serine protease